MEGTPYSSMSQLQYSVSWSDFVRFAALASVPLISWLYISSAMARAIAAPTNAIVIGAERAKKIIDCPFCFLDLKMVD